MSKCVTSGFVNVVMSAFHLRSKEQHAGVGSGLIYALQKTPNEVGRETTEWSVSYILI